MSRKLQFHAWLLAACLAAGPASAAEVAGVKLDDAVKAGGKNMVLNGAGLRSRFFVKVYVGALYVEKKVTSPADVYGGPAPSRIVLHLLRNIDAKTFQESLDDGLSKNSSEAELAAVKEQAGQFSKMMLAIGEVKEGGVVALDFSPAGVAVAYNGKALGTVAGAPFAKALLRVWLGDNPSDSGLKKAMLGG
jgi:long-chain acyl-CoA synthetase